MDVLLYLVLLVSVLLIIYHLLTARKINFEHKDQLPSPPGLPIIGHFHLFKQPLYKTLNKLSTEYGPVFLLRFGSRPALILSERSAIEECLTKNDSIFSNRPLLPSRRDSSYNFSRLAASYGKTWSKLRRFLALQMFSSKPLQMSSNIRSEELRFMVKHLFKRSLNGVQKVDVETLLYMLDFNIFMRMVAGNRCFEFEEERIMGKHIAKAKLDELMQMFTPGKEMALGDYFPFLRWLTFFGVENKLRKLHKKRDVFLQVLLDEHQNSNESPLVPDHQSSPALIDVLLNLQKSESEFYTDSVIKGILELILKAGTYTTFATMTRVSSRLISNPEVMKKARVEIDNLVGESRLLNDEDLIKLSYLHCIIYETLRLYTAEVIFPSRESTEECTVGGYYVPRGTQLFVNHWAVHMDPELWKDPDSFKPERFQESEEDKREFKFIPFGSGRRQCPGDGLAMKVIALSLGTLIQCFEWEMAQEECRGAVETKLNKPLDSSVELIFRPREALIQVLAQL